MRIKVLLFASLREAAGASQLELDLAPDGDAAAVLGALQSRLPRMAALLERSAIAINEVYAPNDAAVHAGDVVAVIPPVSGGSGS